MITKKHDWKKDWWAFGIKIITPQGTTMEFDMPMVPERRGEQFWDKLSTLIGVKSSQPETCAEDIEIIECPEDKNVDD